MRQLKNRYFALRHGRSEANELGIIVSDPATGRDRYGLTATGREQVILSLLRAFEDRLLDSATIIYSSDFRRTLESAEIVESILYAGPVRPTRRLRERYFGEIDGTSDENYPVVWELDEIDPNHKAHGGESVNEVLQRTLSLIDQLERLHRGKKLLLVGHGDPLNILETAFMGINPSQHRHLGYAGPIEQGELRRYGEVLLHGMPIIQPSQ